MTSTNTPAPAGAEAGWPRRPMALFVLARSASTMAFQMQGVAIGFEIYMLTGSPLALGLVGLTQFGAMLAFTLFAGYVADRLDRRWLVAACQLVQAASAAALSLGSFFGWLSVPGIFALVAVSASARACEQPTEQALLPGLVPRAVFPRALALATSVNQGCVALGPAIGGLLYWFGPVTPYAAVSLLLLCGTIAVLSIPPGPSVRPVTKFSLASLLSGLGFIRSRRIVLGAISLDLFTVLLGGAVAMLPVFAVDVLRTDSLGLGLLRGAPAAGALITASVLARLPLRNAGMTMLKSAVAFGLLTVAFALSTSLILSLAILFAMGASNVVGVVIRNSLVQLSTPDELRGRVSAVNSLFTGTSNHLGDFEAGVTAALFGPVFAVALGGVCAAAIGLAWIKLFPEISDIRRL